MGPNVPPVEEGGWCHPSLCAFPSWTSGLHVTHLWDPAHFIAHPVRPLQASLHQQLWEGCLYPRLPASHTPACPQSWPGHSQPSSVCLWAAGNRLRPTARANMALKGPIFHSDTDHCGLLLSVQEERGGGLERTVLGAGRPVHGGGEPPRNKTGPARQGTRTGERQKTPQTVCLWGCHSHQPTSFHTRRASPRMTPLPLR